MTEGMTEGTLVHVTWRDAFSTDSPTDQTDYRCTTIGYVTAAPAGFLGLAQEQTPDGWRGMTYIPEAMVLTTSYLSASDFPDAMP